MTKRCIFDASGVGPAGTTITAASAQANVLGVANGGTQVSTVTAAKAWSHYAVLYTCTATSNSQCQSYHNIPSNTQYVISAHFRLPSGMPSASNKQLIQIRTANGAAQCTFLGMSSNGKAFVQDAAGSNGLFTSATLVANTDYRAEIILTIGASSTTGKLAIKLYDVATNTLIDSNINTTTYNLGTAAIGQVRIGIAANSTTVAWNAIVQNVRVDDGGTAEFGALPATPTLLRSLTYSGNNGDLATTSNTNFDSIANVSNTVTLNTVGPRFALRSNNPTTAAAYGIWTLAADTIDYYVAADFTYVNADTAGSKRMLTFLDASLNQNVSLAISSNAAVGSGHWLIRDAANSAAFNPSIAGVPNNNQITRIEAHIVIAGSSGTVQYRAYTNVSDDTPVYDSGIQTISNGTGTRNIRIGNNDSTGIDASYANVRIGDGSTGWLGPAPQTYTITAADLAGGSDAPSTANGFNVAAADNAGGADSLANNIGYNRALADLAAGSDAATTNAGFAPNFADLAGASDAISWTTNWARAFADAADGSDALATAYTYAPGVGDSAAGSDTVSWTIDYARSLADTAMASDALTISTTSAQEVAHDDIAGATDALTTAEASDRPANDTAAGSDALAVLLDAVRTAADTATGSDLLATALSAVRSASDLATATDALTTVLTGNQSAADTALAVDAIVAALALNRAAADTAGATDAFTVTRDATRSPADVAEATDALTVAAGVSRAASDTAEAVDELITLLTRAVALADVAIATDKITVSLDAGRNLNMILTYEAARWGLRTEPTERWADTVESGDRWAVGNGGGRWASAHDQDRWGISHDQ